MREFREVRKRLSGDQSIDLTGYARVLLGQMKNLMRFQGLRQLVWTKTLPDGTVIRVGSIMGQDFVDIQSPAEAVNEIAQPKFIFLMTPSSSTYPNGVGDKPQVGLRLSEGDWVVKKNLALKYGNVDWRGHNDNDVLTWHGMEGRYFGDPSRFSDEIYHQGRLVSKTPLNCLGAAIHTDTERRWLVMVGKEGAVESVYARPWGGYDHTAELYDAENNPSGWRLLGTHTLTIPEAETIVPYFFNASGTECQCARSHFVSEEEGYDYHRVKISVSADSSNAQWKVITEAYHGVRERTETLIGGQCGKPPSAGPLLLEKKYGAWWRWNGPSSGLSVYALGEGEGISDSLTGAYSDALADILDYLASAAGGGTILREKLVEDSVTSYGLRQQSWWVTVHADGYDVGAMMTVDLTEAGLTKQAWSNQIEAKSSRTYEGKALFAVDYQADQEVLATLEPELTTPCIDHYLETLDIIKFNPAWIPAFTSWDHPWRESYTTGSEVETLDQTGERQINLVCDAWKTPVKHNEVSRLSTYTRTYTRAQGNSYVQTESHNYSQSDIKGRLFYLDLRTHLAVQGEANTVIETVSGEEIEGTITDTLRLYVGENTTALGEQSPELQPEFLGSVTCVSVSAATQSLLLTTDTFIQEGSFSSIVNTKHNDCLGSVYWVSDYNQLDSGYTLSGFSEPDYVYFIFRNTEKSAVNFIYDKITGEITDPLALIPWPIDKTYEKPLLGEVGVF